MRILRRTRCNLRRRSGGAFESSGDARAVRRGFAEANKKAELLKPIIYERLAKVFGFSETGGIGGHCPGAACERLEGVGEANWTVQEQWEEAGAGCPRNCAAPLESSAVIDDSDIGDEEVEYVLERVEDLVLEYKIGGFHLKDYEVWEIELVKFWIKTVEGFENGVQISLKNMIQGYLSPKS